MTTPRNVASEGNDRPGWSAWHSADLPIRLGVSACLLGQEVRYNGGHTRNRFVVDNLGQWVEWVDVCPEVEIGMGVPRPAIRLEHAAGSIRLTEPASRTDYTAKMDRYAERRVRALAKDGLDGYILKKGSPSCGPGGLRVYEGDTDRVRSKDGVGRFAAVLKNRWPGLPTEDEGRLNDPGIRENFIEHVFCRNRWRCLVAGGTTRRRLVAFHTAHKMLLRAHNEVGYRRLGKLVAAAGTLPDRELFAQYETELHNVMQTRATPKKHRNVLQHAMGYLKTALAPAEKRDVLAAIDDYAGGLLPLIVPLTLMRFNIHRYDVTYLKDQLYFDPHPKELMLRNHV